MKKLAILFSIVVLSACTWLGDGAPAEVEKSASDQRDYEYFQLPNGLSVLLVSDVDAKFSAASLDVFVGSGSDPENRPGLAHFLEHMLFLGTEKYPDSAEYQKFIKANAGSHNAYTSFEHTNYFFEVKAAAFDEALDRFAQFFISPMLDAAYVEREKHAVDSEYKARYKNDARRNMDVFKTLLNPEHPFKKFSVGSLESLSDSEASNIREDLKAFYETWYSAKNMSLVVLGSESLPELRAMVEEKFTAVPSGSVPSNHISAPLFVEDFLPKWVTIQPEKNLRELSLVFPMPDQAPLYKSKPMTAVGHVLGHEGKGSLFSYLKAQGWAEHLSAGSAVSYQGGSAFAINIGLTEDGLDHQQDVVLAVFQAIKRLHDSGVPAWVVEELSAINRVSFEFKENANPVHYVMGLSNAMHYYPPEHVLSAEYLIEEYRPDLIADVVAELTLSNVLISVVADGFTNPELSPYYQTPYAVGDLPSSLQANIEAAGVNAAIVLPEPNALLPEDLGLLASSELLPADKPSSKPGVLFQNDGIELWYKPLDQFQLPKATAYYSFQHEALTADIHSAVLTSLYIALLNDQLNEWVYPAQMAGLSFGLYPHSRGVTLKLSGFNDKQPLLLQQLIENIQAATYSAQQFSRVKAEMQRQLSNAQKLPPYQKLMSSWQAEINKRRWLAEDRLAVLNEINQKDVEAWGAKIWRDSYIKALANGNVSAATAKAMALSLQEAVQAKGVVNTQPAIEIVKMPKQAFYTQVPSKHADSGYLNYWQAENDEIATQAQWLLLAKSLEAGYFNQLRTEQQLGYIVFANYYPQLTVPGLTFIVQSPKASVAEIHGATQQFIAQSLQQLAEMPATLFAQYQSALAQKLLEKPKTLAQESDAYWYEMALGQQDFERKQALANEISSLDFESWKASVSLLMKERVSGGYIFGTQAAGALLKVYEDMHVLPLGESPEGAEVFIYH